MNEVIKTKNQKDFEKSQKAFKTIVRICLILGIIVISGFIIYHILNQESGYVTFGLLNSDGKSEDYPTHASINEEIEFYVIVENYLGKNFQFRLKILKGDNNTILSPTEPSNAQFLFFTHKITLNHNQSWISEKLSVSFSKRGSNQIIVVELWQLLETSQEKYYDNLYLKLNITD